MNKRSIVPLAVVAFVLVITHPDFKARAQKTTTSSEGRTTTITSDFKFEPGYQLEKISSPGLMTGSITTPFGRVVINLPSELYRGDIFTGTVRTEPAGQTEAERARNQLALNSMTLEMSEEKTSLTDKTFTRKISASASSAEVLVLTRQGKPSVITAIPIPNQPAPPPSNNAQLPTCGQVGRNIVVMDHCDGVIAGADSCSIGGVQLQPLAESPRMRILLNNNQTPGPTQINYVEQSKETTGPFENLSVTITSPNTNLLRGQTTTMEVVAALERIHGDVSLDVSNDTPGVVSLSGGNNQHFAIHPADVQPDGTFKRVFTVTAIQTGSWRATATVSCPGAEPTVGPQPPQPTPTSTPTPSPAPGHLLPTTTPSPSPSPCAPAPMSTTYTVKNLSTSGESDKAHCTATGINESGNVSGACSPSYFGKSGGAWRAFRTEKGGAVITKADELAFPVGSSEGTSFATAVNEPGHVVGFWSAAGSSDYKAFWHGGGKKSKMINLHLSTVKFTISKAFALNVHDDVVGAAYGPSIGPVTLGLTFDGHAVIWPSADPSKMKDLNDDLMSSVKSDWILRAAFAINGDGEIVGRAYNKKLGKYHAFLLKGIGGEFVDLGALKEDASDSSAAYAISKCGDKEPAIDKVVGYTFTPKAHYGFIWVEAAGMSNMKTLPGYLESYAKAINKKGEVVGAAWGLHTSIVFDAIACLGTCFTKPDGVAYSHGTWYDGKELLDLNKLIPTTSSYEIEVANAINDKGEIVGSAFFKPPTYKSGGLIAKAVILIPAGSPTPVPTKPTSSCPLSIPSGGYIFDNWNICGVMNGPTKDATFTLDAAYLITFIATYHWNDGKGALPAKGISLKDGTGKVFGPWPVMTSAGSGGRGNVNWESHPGVVLPAGTYTVIDPDPATWSQNGGSAGVGFVRVAGTLEKK